MMKIVVLLSATLCIVVLSCTKGKTDYEAEIETVVPEYTDYKEAVAVEIGGETISVETLNGTFYRGYNEIRAKIVNKTISPRVSAMTFLPIRNDAGDGPISCPHRYQLEHSSEGEYFSGYVVFTHDNGSPQDWELYLSVTIANEIYTAKKVVQVHEQMNKNLNTTSFISNDEEQYVIALVSPQRPKVGENALIAGIYRLDKVAEPSTIDFPDPAHYAYTQVRAYTLQLDPRMPEPSMGNHSSPNNKDLISESDGLYHGVVNYTMTGNWTLNFILLNEMGRVVKGTVVPGDFTPGVQGVKSELHIDVLF